MITSVNFYKDFKCANTNCKHNCCIGWTININRKSLEYYKNVKGNLSERLKNDIDYKNSSFKLTDGKRCPFLNKDNLCDIIISLGKDKLCRICNDHPIYRNFLSDRTEIGYGIACENACKNVLGFTDKAEEVIINNRKKTADLTAFEKKIISFRAKTLKIVQNRKIPFETRLLKVLSVCGLNDDTVKSYDWKSFLLSCESLSDDWVEAVKKTDFDKKLFINEKFAIPFEQLFCYFIFRHASSAIDKSDLISKTLFAIVSVFLIDKIFKGDNLEELEDVAREYSAEIEYSEDNFNTFLDVLDELSLKI